jgi:O-antigen/teichoic acid export membrane protein
MTYFVLAMTGVLLFLSFYLGDIVRAPIFWGHPLIAEPFWGGLDIVPIVMLAYLFLGIYNNLIAGIYIEKKTAHLPWITIAGSGVNVAANYLLIPPLGLIGAAYATLASYVVMAATLFVVVQRIYPIEYEYSRLAKIAVSGALVYALASYVHIDGYDIIWKAVLIVMFGVIMFLMKFFLGSELKAVKGMIGRVGFQRKNE